MAHFEHYASSRSLGGLCLAEEAGGSLSLVWSSLALPPLTPAGRLSGGWSPDQSRSLSPGSPGLDRSLPGGSPLQSSCGCTHPTIFSATFPTGGHEARELRTLVCFKGQGQGRFPEAQALRQWVWSSALHASDAHIPSPWCSLLQTHEGQRLRCRPMTGRTLVLTLWLGISLHPLKVGPTLGTVVWAHKEPATVFPSGFSLDTGAS